MGAALHNRIAIERILETILFQSRWLIAPFYLGLVLALVLLLFTFGNEIVEFCLHPSLEPENVILSVLSLIDLSLTGNLVIIVIFSGYENFVSKIDTKNSEDRPSWMGKLDFSGLKMKLIGSIVAISVISLLRAFMKLSRGGGEMDNATLAWLVGLHLTFLASGVLFAFMDWIATQAEIAARRHHQPHTDI